MDMNKSSHITHVLNIEQYLPCKHCPY